MCTFPPWGKRNGHTSSTNVPLKPHLSVSVLRGVKSLLVWRCRWFLLPVYVDWPSTPRPRVELGDSRVLCNDSSTCRHGLTFTRHCLCSRGRLSPRQRYTYWCRCRDTVVRTLCERPTTPGLSRKSPPTLRRDVILWEYSFEKRSWPDRRQDPWG